MRTPTTRLIGLIATVLVGAGALGACSGQTEAAEPAAPTATTASAASDSRIDPYVGMPEVPTFELTSSDVQDGEEMPAAQRSGLFGIPDGLDTSPELSWSGAPEGTQSFVVTMYDADAVTGSGLWHWTVKDIPADITELPSGAGAAGSAELPQGAVTLPGDVGAPQYIGAAPPQGDGAHHYYLTVWALDVPTLDVPATASSAYVGYTMMPHVIGRASLVPVATTA